MDKECYFFGIDETPDLDQVYALIIYDIVSNKKRIKLAKYLQGFGHRIQKSGFEVRLSKSKFNKLISELDRFCTEEDSIRVYKISSRSEVLHWGKDDSVLPEEVIIL